MHSLKRSQYNRLNVVSMTKIGTVEKRLKQINREDDVMRQACFGLMDLIKHNLL